MKSCNPPFPFSSFLTRLVLFGAVWGALTGFESGGLLPGLFSVAAAAWISMRLVPPVPGVSLARLIGLLPRFLMQSLMGGIDVASRAFTPRMRLRPLWVKRKTPLPRGAQAALGAELSLMPGTLAARCSEGCLLVHLLDRDGGYETAIDTECARLERVIGKGTTS